jgi:hypothetical protein
MSDKTAARLAGASGILYAGLLLGAGAIGDDALRLRCAVVGLVLFVPFLAYLCGVLRRAEGEPGWLSTTALAAGVVGLAIKLGSGAVDIAGQAAGIDPRVHGTLEDVSSGAFVLSMVPLALVAASAAVVALRTGVLPRWLGWLAAVTAAALVANGLFLHDGPGFVLFLVWTAITGAVLTRRPHGAPATAVSAQPATAG